MKCLIQLTTVAVLLAGCSSSTNQGTRLDRAAAATSPTMKSDTAPMDAERFARVNQRLENGEAEPLPLSASAAAGVALYSISDPGYWGISIDSPVQSIANPKGDGFIVWLPQTRWLDQGVERHFCWLVLSTDEVFPANGATKTLSTSLGWYRDAPPSVHDRAGWERLTPASAWLGIAFDGQ